MGVHLPSMSNHTIMIIALVIFTLASMMPKGDADTFFLKNEAGRQITFRCQSGDEDMKTRVISPGASFRHTFNTPLFWRTTLYFCHFYLDNKDKVFDVWTYKPDKDLCTVWKKNPWPIPDLRWYFGQVEWVIKEDGFYKHCVYRIDYGKSRDGKLKQRPSDTALEKKHDWW